MEMIGKTITSGDFQSAELATYKARTYLGLRQMPQLKALQNSTIPGEQATAKLTIFMNSDKMKNEAKEGIMELVKNSKDLNATYLAAVLLAHQEEYLDAINLIAAYDTLDMKALRCQIYFLMRRADLADPIIKDVNRTAEESAVTKMITALYNVATGNHQEAFLTYCDLQALYGEEANENPSTLLLCAKAGCNLHRGLYDEAMEDLKQALVTAARDPDVLINLACCSVHKDEDWTPHYQILKEKYQTNPFVQKMNQLDQAFASFR